MSSKIIRQCATCGVSFAVWPYKLANGRGKYCSRRCEHPLTDKQRFESHVDREGPIPAHRPELGPCAIWMAHRSRDGYGGFAVGSRVNGGKRRSHKAHRYGFFLEHGRWPADCALHACDNPSCVRVSHLFEGDRVDNNADKMRKGRYRNGVALGERHGQAKLTADDVRAIRKAAALGESVTAIAVRYPVGRRTVSDVLSGKNWSHVS